MQLRLLLLSLLVLATFATRAAHIVGGDMFYECLGGNQYRITLKVYRDCFSNGPNVAGYDSPAFITIYNSSSVIIETVEVFFQGRGNIPPETNNPCLTPPSNVCVEQASFIFDYTLPPIAGGYNIVYARCCRNATIGNIVGPDQVGATYFVHIDPLTTPCNNSPEFDDFPPIVICAGQPLVFDHSATDPDGDVIVYELCTPFTGGDQTDPQPNPPMPPPFNNVQWRTPYSIGNLLGGTALSINPNTGILTGTPQLQGQFVVGVCANEYRNGVLIGTTRRDFQFNVVSCIIDLEAKVPIIDTVGAGQTGTSGLYTYACRGFDVKFTNLSRNASFYKWNFGDLTTFADTSSAFQPTYLYPDTGQYIVTLIANPGLFCADTTKVYVRVYPGFTVGWDFQPVCEGSPVQFADQSTSLYGSVVSWQWNFADNTSSNIRSPSHLYGQDGIYNVKMVAQDNNGCKDSITKAVTVYSKPDVDISISPACVNQNVLIGDLTQITYGGFGSRQWYLNGQPFGNDPIFSFVDSVLGTKTLKLVVQSGFGCIDSFAKQFTVYPLPIVGITADTALCLFDTIQLFATGGNQYIWAPGTGLSSANVPNPYASPAQTTSYVVQVTDSHLCQNFGNVRVTVNPLPPTDAGRDTFLCLGDTYQLQGANGISFHWEPAGLVSNPDIADPTTSPDSSTTFYLTTFNNFGCDNIDSMFLEVQHPINATLANPPEVCIYDTVQLEVTDGKYFQWSPPNGLSDTTVYNPFAFPLQTTTYTVIANNDCPQFADTLTVDLVVHPLPLVDAGLDTTVYRDESTRLQGVSNGVSFEWKPSDYLDDATSLNPLSTPYNTIRYELFATSEYGCKNSDTVRINVEVKNLILVPNAFTPNQDGLNDVFRIIKTLNIERVYDIFVFNRWGNKVYEAHNSLAFWDGTYNGQPQDLGVYVYVIRAVTRDGHEITETGNVTLLR
ncbi:hypothetical protein BH09BAC1_BH09BAC1_25790 [soil metagenome]